MRLCKSATLDFNYPVRLRSITSQRILCLARRSRPLNLIYIWGNERSCLHLLTGALSDLAGAEDGLPELAGRARALRDGARALALLRLHCTAQRRLQADEQRGLLCPLCTSPPRRCLRSDELLMERYADPRAPPLPMSLYAHVLTALACPWLRLSAASGTACPPPALLSHVGCVWSCGGAKRAPGAEFNAASDGCIGFLQSCRIACSCCVLPVESCPCRAMSVRVRCVPVHGAVVHL